MNDDQDAPDLDPETEALFWRATEKLDSYQHRDASAKDVLTALVQETAPGDAIAQAQIIDELLKETE
jgi:hypothetical protein